MRKLAMVLLCGATMHFSVSAQQYFDDNFESYTVSSYLGPQSNEWTTWSSNDGGSEDVLVTNADAHSGSKSIYFESSGGGGPHDVVLDFGGLYTSGRFKFTMWMKIPTNKNAYFNFQGGSGIGQSWACEIYWYSGGTWSTNVGGLSSTFPVNQWFELVVDMDLDNDIWEFYIDGVSKGSINNTSGVSYIDLYEASSSSEWYVDDVSFCVNYACNPELALSNLSLSPSTTCTHHPADVSLTVTNNSTFSANSFLLGLDIGPNRITQTVNLNLGAGNSTTLNLAGLFNSQVSGSVSVKAINLSGDIVGTNDTAKTTATVKPSPSGTILTQGSVWDSPRPSTSGIPADPDIITDGSTLSYSIIPPTGYSNSSYGSSWDITNLAFYTQGGTMISNSMYTFTAPSGGNNASISFTPGSALLDSNVSYCFNVNSMANGCDSMLCRYIRVVPRPVAGWNAPDACDKQDLVFNNTTTILSGLVTYMWDFGDGATSTQQAPTHMYATYGSYTVKMYAISDYGYVDSLIQTVNVHQLPVADFKVQNACENVALSFTDQSFIPTGTPTYSWDFGDNAGNSASSNPTYLYAAPGLYTVEFTITVNGCSDTKTKYATQAERAVPGFTSSTACNNTNAVFTNTTTIGSGTYGSEWKFGDGTSITAQGPKHKYSGFGNFDVTLIVTTDLGCRDSVTHTVALIESPHASYTMSTVCAAENVQFTNTSSVPGSGANAYMWDFGNMQTSNLDNPTTEYLAPGSYTIVLIATNANGCADTMEQQVMIDTKPIAGFVANDVCDGEEVTFTNNTINIPFGASYMWDYGNGKTSMGIDTSFTYSAAGDYDVMLLVSTPNGCTDTAVKRLHVNAIPDASFLFASAEKGDGTMTFTANAPQAGNSFYWDMGDGDKYTTKDVTHTFNFSSNFEVKLTVTSDAGCVENGSEMVAVFPESVTGAENQTIRVYPNPASEQLNLDLSEISGTVQIRVYDAQGKQVIDKKTVAGQATLDVAALTPGNYMIRVLADSGVYTARVQILR